MKNNQDPLDQLIRDALAVEPSPGFDGRIRRHVQQQAVAPRRPFFLIPALSAVAAVVLLMLLWPPQPEVPKPVAIHTAAAAPLPVEKEIVEPIKLPQQANSKVERIDAVAPPQPVLVVRTPEVTDLVVPPPSVDPIHLIPLKKFSVEDSVKPLPQMALEPGGVPPLRLDSFELNEGGTE